MLCRLLQRESHPSRIAKAIAHIRKDITRNISVAYIANIAGMSISSFHYHFKAITATTPLQYQKDIRLLEERRLLQEGNHNVSSVACEVGHESPTQFNREYSRKVAAALPIMLHTIYYQRASLSAGMVKIQSQMSP